MHPLILHNQTSSGLSIWTEISPPILIGLILLVAKVVHDCFHPPHNSPILYKRLMQQLSQPQPTFEEENETHVWNRKTPHPISEEEGWERNRIGHQEQNVFERTVRSFKRLSPDRPVAAPCTSRKIWPIRPLPIAIPIYTGEKT